MRIIQPSEWDINIRKIIEDNKELYEINYEEFVVKPVDISFEVFEKIVKDTFKLLDKLSSEENFEYNYNEYTDSAGRLTAVRVYIVAKGSLSKISNMVVSEFLPFSSIGKMSIGEIIVGNVYNILKDKVIK